MYIIYIYITCFQLVVAEIRLAANTGVLVKYQLTIVLVKYQLTMVLVAWQPTQECPE